MTLLLKRFSQEVDLENPEVVHYFLVFDHGGKEIRLPVQQETTEALAKALYSNGHDAPKDSTEVTPGIDEVEFATSFGGDEPPPNTDDIYEGPESEEDVPSV